MKAYYTFKLLSPIFWLQQNKYFSIPIKLNLLIILIGSPRPLPSYVRKKCDGKGRGDLIANYTSLIQSVSSHRIIRSNLK